MEHEIKCSVCDAVVGYSSEQLDDPVVCLLCGKPEPEEEEDEDQENELEEEDEDKD